jgi:hypothetical protein
MTPEQVANKAQKIIKMNKAESVVNKVYFNPMFAQDLSRKVPEMKDGGLSTSQTETETGKGTVISGKVLSPGGTVLELGSVLLDGETVKISKPLVTVDEVVDFIKTEFKAVPVE